MRMDQSQGLTAADVLNRWDEAELARIFWEYGGEESSRRVARAIVFDRKTRPFERTLQLAGLMERLLPRGGRKSHPATKVFQALRMAVNDELGSLRRGLVAAVEILKPGGRAAIITFHSAEDRVVKEFGRLWSRDYEPAEGVDVPELRRPRPAKVRWVQRKAVKPGADELRENPRSRSAQCRVFEKL
jgi:16S rRNA (cytosine1402-N4)-methyltransferase